MATHNGRQSLASTAEHSATARAIHTAAPLAAPAQLSEGQLDLLHSHALQQELPGLALAFDEPLMQAALQGALFDTLRPRATIEGCEVEQATYVPGECVILRYTLTIRDAQSGQAREALVSGRLFPSRAACDAYAAERLQPLVGAVADRDEVALFDAPVGVIADLHMALHAWPIDGDLPALMGATDPRRLKPILSQLLPALQGQPFAVDDCRVELVDYGRQHRATLRYHVRGRAGDEPRELLVYGKVTGDGSGAMAESISSTLRERVRASATGYRFSVPLALPWQPEIKLSLLEALPGSALIADQLKARLRGKPAPAESLTLEAMIDACARIAATLHASGLELGRRRTLDDELAALRSGVAAVQRVSPELGARLASAVDEIALAGAHTAPLPLCCNHGDFTYGQILFDGTSSGLIDFDSVSQAEPALDLGQFLTYVRVASLKSKLAPAATAALIDQLGDRFLDAYADAAGDLIGDREQLRGRVRIYRAVSLVRRSLRSWQKFKPGRIASALEVLDEELAALDPVR
ncbi:MAG: phosphotransferase [Kouleothrix sp.]|nr:phosphotransferase [Kouleothrix sp.]